MADKDNNGYLDKHEANQNPLYRNLFPMMDRDSDGKLFEKEVVAYLDKMKELQEAAMQSCASLAVKDQGAACSTWSIATVTAASASANCGRWSSWSINSTATATAVSVTPRSRTSIAWTCGPAPPAISSRRAPGHLPKGTNEPALPERTSGPLVPQDGPQSRRRRVAPEFLGTDAEFRKIDADGDGLISVEEAVRADKLFRKKKSQPRRRPSEE